MTTAAGLARTSSSARRPATRVRTPLQLVPAARTSAPRTPFLVLIASLLVLGLLALLGLNTLLARNAFALHTLTGETRALAATEQSLQREVELLRSPQNLAEQATGLGMVQAGPPAFLRLSDGAVLGATDPAAAPEPAAGTAASPKPGASVKATPGAGSSAKPSPAPSSAAAKPSTKPSPAAVKPSAKPSPAAVKPSAKPSSGPTTAPRTAATPGAAR